MKKIDTSNIVAGVRKLGLVKASFDHLQESYKDIVSDLLQGILAQASGYTSLFGCVNSGGGSVYTISAGAIYGSSQQEIFEIAAFSGTATGGNVPVLSLVTTYRAGDPVIYSDASSLNTHAIVKLQWTFGASGSGLADFSALQNLKTRINSSLLDVPGQISAAVAALVASSPATLDTLKELADALADDPNFATTITNLISTEATNRAAADSTEVTNRTNADNTLQTNINTEATNRANADNLKANKSQVAWTNLTLINGWANFVGHAKYRVDEFGKVHVSAYLTAASATSDVFANIPGGITPTFDDLVMCCTAFNGAAQVPAIFVAGQSSSFQINAKNTSYKYKINGISYWIDEEA